MELPIFHCYIIEKEQFLKIKKIGYDVLYMKICTL